MPFEMSFDHWVSLFTAIISFIGIPLVILQLRATARQLQLQSLAKVNDINRELLTLGFSHPQLFNILADAPAADPVWERRYLQLWLNQFAEIHSYMYESIFKRELEDSLTHDICDFMEMKNMRCHWRDHGAFYPESFQKFVNDIIKKSEPPVKAAHPKSGS